MSDTVTTRYGLPLMQAAQAQKHVTLNEALVRLDGVANLTLQSIGRTDPPAVVVDGQCFAIGAAPVNAWSGQAGKIAIGASGGWIFVAPTEGLQAVVLDNGCRAIYRGGVWVVGALTLSSTGAGMVAGLAEADVTLTAGSSKTTTLVIPAGAMVIGASARVKQAITGSLASWSLGTAGALDRFGSGLGLGTGSYARGILGTPTTYWTAAPLIVTAVGGTFSGGQLRLAVHWWELRLPD